MESAVRTYLPYYSGQIIEQPKFCIQCDFKTADRDLFSVCVFRVGMTMTIREGPFAFLS